MTINNRQNEKNKGTTRRRGSRKTGKSKKTDQIKSEPDETKPDPDQWLASYWLSFDSTKKITAPLSLPFLNRCVQEMSERGIFPGRNELRQRFATICTETLEFSAVYNKMKKISVNLGRSTSDTDLINVAKEDYYYHAGKHFNFLSAWNLLRDHPRWLAMGAAESLPQHHDHHQSSSNSNLLPSTHTPSQLQEQPPPIKSSSSSTRPSIKEIKPIIHSRTQASPTSHSNNPPNISCVSSRSQTHKPPTSQPSPQTHHPTAPPTITRTTTRSTASRSTTQTHSLPADKPSVTPSKRPTSIELVAASLVPHYSKEQQQPITAIVKKPAERKRKFNQLDSEAHLTRSLKKGVPVVQCPEKKTKFDGADLEITQISSEANNEKMNLLQEQSIMTSLQEERIESGSTNTIQRDEARIEAQRVNRIQAEVKRIEASTRHSQLELGIMEKDLRNCTDEYEKQFFLIKKRQILAGLMASTTPHSPDPSSQLLTTSSRPVPNPSPSRSFLQIVKNSLPTTLLSFI
ncbi:hypothetical protein VP01_1999g4 [Puccinia sorghi]|uniref:No apical meristem-associated C-terminal domain-containing protein n=1 Tax=Puccinia sorghi TaxID=27349 RepID=A0A0L6VBM1_9BASI|nr:hypothetical protein VP01_1999g4 [Puccinia sorghi]